MSESVADIFTTFAPNIVTDTVDKTIQCGPFEESAYEQTSFFGVAFIGIQDVSPAMMVTMMQFMRNMENIVKSFTMGEAIITVCFM